jgi:hypothetical protein
MKNKNNNNAFSSTSKFKITLLIAIFGMFLIIATLTLNNGIAVVFAQTINVNSSKSDNQTQGLQDLCKLPPQELLRDLHGMHLSGC